MKQVLICLLITMVLFMCCACRTDTSNTAATVSKAIDETQTTASSQEENEVDAHNRKMIGDALGVAEDSRNIKTILSALNTIGAGEIQQAQALEENSEPVLDIVAEDGALYRIYLTGSGKVDGVKNATTGDWVITSAR